MSKLSPLLAQIAPVQNSGLGIPETGTLLNYVVRIVNIGLTLVGIVAGIFLIISGIRYISSHGDETETKKAKNAILYTVLGLVVIGLAALIVNFVVTAIGPAGGGGAGGGRGGGGGGGNLQPSLPPGRGGGIGF